MKRALLAMIVLAGCETASTPKPEPTPTPTPPPPVEAEAKPAATVPAAEPACKTRECHLQQHCDDGDFDVCSELGCAAVAAGDPATGAKLHKKACDGGFMLSCSHLGFLKERGLGVPQDLVGSAALYQQACDGGSATGCYNLGIAYRDGNGVAVDAGKSRAFIAKACQGGEPGAC